MRISTLIKSGALKSVKWDINEDTKSGCFAIKVPVEKATKNLRDWLDNRAQVSTWYDHSQKALLAVQYMLPKGNEDFRALWRVTPWLTGEGR